MEEKKIAMEYWLEKKIMSGHQAGSVGGGGGEKKVKEKQTNKQSKQGL